MTGEDFLQLPEDSKIIIYVQEVQDLKLKWTWDRNMKPYRGGYKYSLRVCASDFRNTSLDQARLVITGPIASGARPFYL
jgi:hypothetical protein